MFSGRTGAAAHVEHPVRRGDLGGRQQMIGERGEHGVVALLVGYPACPPRGTVPAAAVCQVTALRPGR